MPNFRSLLCIVSFFIFLNNTSAQSVAINTDGSTADASAILDVKSTGKGMLIPRLTTVQRTAITSPATGLLVFDTDTNAFWFYNGTAWTKLEASGKNWSVTGNSGTTAATNFIGSTDARDVVFKTGNTERMRLLSAANTKNIIATISSGDLEVNGVTVGHGPTGVPGNTALGYQTMYNAAGGDYNTAIGGVALFSNRGSNNTATGYGALYSNTTGNDNTANGRSSLFSNTTGTANTAIGYMSLFSNTTGFNNTASGYMSLNINTTGMYNTASGYMSLRANTTGIGNTAIGNQALFANATGNGNTATGNQALSSNVNGNNNTAYGVGSLFSNTDGTENTAYGTGTLSSNTIATGNTAMGYRALSNNTGQYNTGNGYMSMAGNTGDYNTACGAESLRGNMTGSKNTALGYGADLSFWNFTNATAIGYGAIVNASNKVVIGNNDVTVIGGQVSWSTLSDGRFKTNVKEDVPGLDFIMQLRPVNYNFLPRKFEEHQRQNMPDSIKNAAAKRAAKANYSEAENIVHTGFIAQEVEQVVKKKGYKFNAVHTPANTSDNYSIAYSEFVVPLVKAVQEQQKQIEAQKKIIMQQQQTLEALMKRLEKLEQK